MNKKNDSLQAVILVGGKGTRLKSLTKDTPKPLLSINGQPFLTYLIYNLSRHGFKKIILLAGYLPEKIKEYVAENHFPDIEIIVLTETTPAGTGGALIQAMPYLNDEFLMLNGDSFFDINILDLVYSWDKKRNIVGRLALKRIDDNDRYGCVDLDGDSISGFSGIKKMSDSNVINAGVYWLSNKIVEYIEKSPCSIEQDIFPRLAKMKLLDGQIYDGFFLDIGVIDDLSYGEKAIPACFNKPAVFLELSSIINHDIFKLVDWHEDAPAFINKFNNMGYYVFIYDLPEAGESSVLQNKKVVSLLNIELRKKYAHYDEIIICNIPKNEIDICENVKYSNILINEFKKYIKEWGVNIKRSIIFSNTDIGAIVADDLKINLIAFNESSD